MDFALLDPDTTPIMMPPEGVVPNFENPVSNAYISRDVTLVFFPVMVVFLALRLCSRIFITRSFGIDDAVHIAAAASMTIDCGILLSLLDKPNGRHGWDVPLSIMTDSYLQINFTYVIVSAVSLLLVKLSLLALYLRMFKPVRLVRIIIYSSVIIVACFYIGTAIAELVVGSPKPNEGWPAAQRRYASFGLDISVSRGVFGVVSDFAILFIPLSQVMKLQLPLRRKITLVCIFLSGLLACICSLVHTVWRFWERGDSDYTWANTKPNALFVVEVTVGHICGSVPALPALITSLKKNEKVVSFLQYLRSSRDKDYQSDTPTSAPSTEKVDMPPSKLNGLGTRLRTLFHKVHLFKSSPKERSLRIYNLSEYDDLEYAEEVDYHAHVRQGNAANALTQQR